MIVIGSSRHQMVWVLNDKRISKLANKDSAFFRYVNKELNMTKIRVYFNS